MKQTVNNGSKSFYLIIANHNKNVVQNIVKLVQISLFAVNVNKDSIFIQSNKYLRQFVLI